jgi:hypothetical protein
MLTLFTNKELPRRSPKPARAKIDKPLTALTLLTLLTGPFDLFWLGEESQISRKLWRSPRLKGAPAATISFKRGTSQRCSPSGVSAVSASAAEGAHKTSVESSIHSTLFAAGLPKPQARKSAAIARCSDMLRMAARIERETGQGKPKGQCPASRAPRDTPARSTSKTSPPVPVSVRRV